jgi:hypothetical protein
LGVCSGFCINQHGIFSRWLPPGDALASGAWWEPLLSVAGIKKEVNIINSDNSTEVV